MDLFESADPQTAKGDNSPIFSVSELSGALKKTVEGSFSNIRVRGEIGRVTRPASGHIYLDIKDDKSVINCNLWKGVANKIGFLPEEGMEVIAKGKLSTYAPQSKYNLIIESLEIAGEGALMALLEKRKKALAGEGLFDPTRKQSLPYLPKRIGVITSRSGAVIKDILHRLSDRFPVEVILWPVTVQGEKCASEVTAAIQGFNALDANDPHKPDVIIVARGGGSIEDLWGFNEEIVVRAASASTIPLISAVGHETDTTLIDYASDKRAPTPTAAAEMAVPVRADLQAFINDLDTRRLRALERTRSQSTQKLRDLARAIPRPESFLQHAAQRFDIATTRLAGALDKRLDQAKQKLGILTPQLSASKLGQNLNAQRERLSLRSERLTPALTRGIDAQKQKLASAGRLLEALSYKSAINRGFAVIRDEHGQILTDADHTRKANEIRIEQKGGETRARPIKE